MTMKDFLEQVLEIVHHQEKPQDNIIVHHQEKPQDSSISEDRNRTILAGENALLEIEACVAKLHP